MILRGEETFIRFEDCHQASRKSLMKKVALHLLLWRVSLWRLRQLAKFDMPCCTTASATSLFEWPAFSGKPCRILLICIKTISRRLLRKLMTQ